MDELVDLTSHNSLNQRGEYVNCVHNNRYTCMSREFTNLSVSRAYSYGKEECMLFVVCERLTDRNLGNRKAILPSLPRAKGRRTTTSRMRATTIIPTIARKTEVIAQKETTKTRDTRTRAAITATTTMPAILFPRILHPVCCGPH